MCCSSSCGMTGRARRGTFALIQVSHPVSHRCGRAAVAVSCARSSLRPNGSLAARDHDCGWREYCAPSSFTCVELAFLLWTGLFFVARHVSCLLCLLLLTGGGSAASGMLPFLLICVRFAGWCRVCLWQVCALVYCYIVLCVVRTPPSMSVWCVCPLFGPFEGWC